ncbi:MAG TPA: formimidoylglutamate deiminase [Solirubrobacteraceae bacterium]|nr:formimidoylglutamate deiminase [Solirubrobacteraceae bacterium]
MSAAGAIGEQGARATIPAMPNAHSHAFQRALRGRAERPGDAGEDDFWTWRTEMFRLADGLNPTTMRQLAFEAYSEMRGAGYGVVGEFHYVHHQPDGTPYAERNEMALAVAEAAVEAGLPIVLLPAAYHRGGWANGSDLPPAPGQRRFCDPDVSSFLERVEGLRSWAASVPGVEVGIAAHSVRAAPRSWLEAIASYSEAHGIVRHVHASEQRRELEECQAEHGCSPIELLLDTGFLGAHASVIHGIHVSANDIGLLARSGATVVSCPTTEGNLGDGYLPAMAYAQARVPLAIGSDSQVRIDPFEEARELETGSRRERQLRTGLLAAMGDLWGELCRNGCASLGLDPELVMGRAVTIDLEHPDLRGIDAMDLPLALVTCASAAVVTP